MNKIFKVIWNHTTQSFVVTSEISKAHGKTKSTRLASAALAVAAALGLSNLAQAAVSSGSGGQDDSSIYFLLGSGAQPNGLADGKNSISIGNNATYLNHNSQVLIGMNIHNQGKFGDVAIGTQSTVGGGSDVFGTTIGYNSQAYSYSTAIGAFSSSDIFSSGVVNALNKGAVSVGTFAKVDNADSATALGSGTKIFDRAHHATAIGAFSQVGRVNATAIGNEVLARGQSSVAIGDRAITGLQIGTNSGNRGFLGTDNAVAVGTSAAAISKNSLALGTNAVAGGYNTAVTADALYYGGAWMGRKAYLDKRLQELTANVSTAQSELDAATVAYNADPNNIEKATALAKKAAELKAFQVELAGITRDHQLLLSNDADNATAIGYGAKALNNNAISIGTNSTVTGENGLAIGVGNVVTGKNSGSIGDPSVNNGIGSYTYGNDNAIGNNTNNAFVVGNNNQLGATTTYSSEGKQAFNATLTNTQSASSSVVLGNRNYVNSDRTYVLGSGIGTKGDVGALARLAISTVANSVYLGDSSTARAASGTDTVKNYTVDGVEGTTTTAGDKGQVQNVTINSVTFGDFAGQTADGVVTVGAAGKERRIQNVAAGSVSATSTDAINGSQLYAVMDKVASQGKQSDTYFHTNDGTNSGGNATTNLGKPNESAGAAAKNSMTAGVNATVEGATSVNSIAMGYGANITEATTMKDGTLVGSSNSIAMGTNATVKGQKSVAIGYNTNITASADNETSGVAIGDTATVNAKNSIAIGYKANVTTTGQGSSIALGDQSSATNSYAYAIGTKAAASGTGAMALSYNAQAKGQNSVALGESATAGISNDTSYGEIAIGTKSNATAKYSSAVGVGATASGEGSVANGHSANATGNSAVAIARLAAAAGQSSLAIGERSNASKSNAVALGKTARALGENSMAIGLSSHATDTNATAIGNTAKAWAVDSLSFGTNAKVNTPATNGISIGKDSLVSGANGAAIGNATNALANAVAIGNSAKANKTETIALGNEATAETRYALAIGNKAVAGNTVATVLGGLGYRAAAIGDNAKAIGNDTIAFGTNAKAGAVSAIAIGRNTNNTGSASVAIGDNVTVSAARSVALGRNINVTKEENVVLGSWSTETSATITEAGKVDQITNATVGGVTYDGFAGTRSVGVVSFGRDKSDGEGGDGKDGERRLINVGAGKISENSTDAINGSQLYSVIKNTFFNLETYENGGVADDSEVTDEENKRIRSGDTFALGAGSGINISQVDKGYEISIDKGEINVDEATGKVTTPDLQTENKVATTYDVVNAISKSGFKLSVEDNTNATVVNPGEQVDLNNTDDNIVITKKDSDNNVTFNLAKELKNLTSANFTNTAGDITTINSNGITINPAGDDTKANVTLTKDGLNNGGNKITNVANGTEDNDAVNYSQLKAVSNAVTAVEGLQVYFHTNNGTNADTGDATTNLGKVNEAAGATALNAVTAGVNAKASAEKATAIGLNANASGVNAMALGNATRAGENAVALGNRTTALGTGTVAIGNGAFVNARSANGIAIGNGARAVNPAAGPHLANGQAGIAIGALANAGQNGIDIGQRTQAVIDANKRYGEGGHRGATVIGTESYNGARHSSILGSGTQIKTDNTEEGKYASAGGTMLLQGVGAVSSGAYNLIDASASDKKANGVANVVNGSGNNVTGSSGTFVLGSGNSVENAYKADSDESLEAIYKFTTTGDAAELAKAKLGSVTLLGNNNNLNGVTDSLVAGAGNTFSNISNSQLLGSNITAKADTKNLVVVGDNATTTFANATALGTNTKVEHENSVALGAGSATTAGVDTDKAEVNGIAYGGFAGKTVKGVVSVGDKTKERQIQNVAAGQINENSTDAINGSQLYSVLINAAWKVFENNGAREKSLVNTGDKVSFNNGNYTTAQVGTEANNTTNVTFNVDGAKLVADNSPVVYTDKAGNKVVKGTDGNYYQAKADGTPDTAKKVEPNNIVASMQNITNGNQPTAGDAITLGNIASAVKTLDGSNRGDKATGDNPTTIDATSLLGNALKTAYSGLADLVNAPQNHAVTVADLRNLGWVVSATGNNYADDVRHANEVRFVGTGLAKVEGKTTRDGVREITVNVEAGQVVATQAVDNAGNPVTKVGDKFYKTEDIDPATGKPKTGAVEIPVAQVTQTPNSGAGLVSGNQVADAIQTSGFVVGKQTAPLAATDFKNEDERVNPDDQVRFADGNNTNVKLATKESVDASGKKVTTTTVKVDVTGLPISYTDANGTQVVKVGDKFYTVDANGNPTTKEVAKDALSTNLVNANAAPNEKGDATKLGNVADGAVNSTSKDAVNGSQLYAVGNATANILGGGSTVNPTTGAPQGFSQSLNTTAGIAATGDYKPTVPATTVAGAIENLNSYVNAGWKVGNNSGTVVERIAPNEQVNFVDSDSISAKVVANNQGGANVSFEIKTGSLSNNNGGSTGSGGFVTANQVANAINNSGFNLTASGNTETGSRATAELIKPTNKVELAAGKNLTVKHEDGGKITFATAENVDFTTVNSTTVTIGDPTDPKKSTSLTSDGSALNVGGDKITGVAAGDIRPTSTDAVNGAQIYALTGGATTTTGSVTVTNRDGSTTYNNVILDEKGNPALVTYNVKTKGEHITNSVITAINNMNTEGIKFFHTNDGRNVATKPRPADQRYNSEDSSASEAYATAIGYKASAEAASTVAIGNAAVAKGENAIAIGINAQANEKNTISIGNGNIVNGENSGAIGDPSKIDAANSYSVGNNNEIAAGQSDVFALGNEVKATASNSVFLGSKSGTFEQENATVGTNGVHKKTASSHYTYNGENDANVAGVNNAVGVVSVGNAEETRQVQGVAAGVVSATSTDAINGSQLYYTNKAINDKLKNVGDTINKLGDTINKNNKDLRGGIAGTNAAASLPQVYLPGKSMVAASAGTYKGQGAIAVGYSRASDNGKLILKLQGNANTRGDVGAGIGIGYQW